MGTFLDTDTDKPTTGQAGDYIIVIDTSVTPRTANVWKWNGTAFADTGKSVEDFGLQFATGQAVNSVGIDNGPTAGGDNLVKSGGVFNSEKLLGQDMLGGNEEITGFSLLPYTVNADGKFGTSGYEIYKHAAIPVQEGDIYYLIGTSPTCHAAFATSDEYSGGGDIPLVPNTAVMLMPDIGKYYKFVIPTGCTYLLFNAGSNYGTRIFKHFDHDLKLLVGASNGVLSVDVIAKQFTLTDDTKVVCEGKLYTLSGSLSYASLRTDGVYCLILKQGELSIIPYREVVGKNVFAIFRCFYSPSFGSIIQDIIYSAIPTSLGRQDYMLNGFSIAPINFDNVNKKVVWPERLYFRIRGQAYVVEPGELNYSTYEGTGTTLALVVELTNTINYSYVCTANLKITYNNLPESSANPGLFGNYVIAWFHRNVGNWTNGVVDNSISIMPITIDGKDKIETKLEPIKSELENLQSDTIKYYNFPILPLVNKGITASGLGPDNTKRASQETLFAVPHNGCTIKVNFSISNMVMGIRSGANADNLSTNYYWMADGDSYTIPVTHNYYRVSFALTADSTSYYDIVASDVEELISNGSVSVKYMSKDKGITERLYDSDAFVKAAILNLDNTLQGNGMLEFPLFAHITDAHGDITRIENAVDYSKYLGVDAMFATGDIIANNINDNFEGLSNKLAKYDDMPTLYCRGNHETYGNSDVNFDVYGKYYQAIATKYNYNITEGKTYYYKDFDSKKIRVIAVDPYEKNIVTNNTCAYSQDQINWFIATIKSTPQDYGILVIVHSPESVPYSTPSIQPIAQKDKFFLDGTPLYWSTPKGVSIPPLMKIIEAFISRSLLQTTFTETTQTGQETININADFTSGVNTGVEFIAWVCGHEHLDLIGEYNRSSYGLNHRQLVLNTTCATALYGSDSYPYLNNMSDLPRGGLGVVQDAITIYAIDRGNHEVRIARCGSRFSNKFVERNCMAVKYC